MFCQWIKLVFIRIIKGFFTEIRAMVSTFLILAILVGGLEIKFILFFFVLIAILYSPEILRCLKDRINNKKRY